MKISTNSEDPAVLAYVRRRCRVTETIARLIAELAGIGRRCVMFEPPEM